MERAERENQGTGEVSAKYQGEQGRIPTRNTGGGAHQRADQIGENEFSDKDKIAMKRELKFRAWHTEQKRMFEVYGIGKDFVTENTLDGVDHGHNAFCDDDMNFIEIMQYTELKDKNGKEIYEGDIVFAKHWTPSHFVIKYIEGGFCGTFKGARIPTDINLFYDSSGCAIQLVGNIFEHPELIII